jgi:hypothetical protein
MEDNILIADIRVSSPPASLPLLFPIDACSLSLVPMDAGVETVLLLAVLPVGT